MTERAPYGTWQSEITAVSLAGNATTISDVLVDYATSVIYHIEDRPAEGGRSVLVESVQRREIVPKDANVRTGVHEYGTAAAVVNDGIALYSNLTDNRVYKVNVRKGSTAEPVTPDNQAFRYACLDVYPSNHRFVVSILEDHTIDTPATVVNTLVIVDTQEKTILPLVAGADFYAHPKFSPDGTKLAYQHWNHPNMPWENSEVVLADVSLTNGLFSLSNATTISSHGSNNFPSWANNNTLCWVCDISGFINPWKYSVSSAQAMPILPSPVQEDFGGVMWRLCFCPYAIIDDAGTTAVWAAYRKGSNVLYKINIETGELKELDSPYVAVECMRTVSESKHQFTFLGGKVDEGTKVILGSAPRGGVVSFVPSNQSNEEVPYDPSLISIPQGISLKVPPNDELLHVIYYPPHNPAYAGSNIPGEKPPCVVNCHGGPTAMASVLLSWKIQYWTTRGFAWLDVNYGGSTGYGKEYTNRLALNWGIVDVEDCIKASQLLASPPYSFIDLSRMVIRGSSSGGLTVLNALSHSSDTGVYAAATSLYGVADLVGLMKDTHKFESHYMFSLVGGSPDDIEQIKERSPINYVDNIQQPLLLLQGEIDRVVPKEQSDAIYERIRSRGGVVEYKLYPNEGHGFRGEEAQSDSLIRELAFYRRVFGLPDTD